MPITVKKNEIISAIEAIEGKIQSECDGYCMDDEDDRAQMAWWIYNQFCRGTQHARVDKGKFEDRVGKPTGKVSMMGEDKV